MGQVWNCSCVAPEQDYLRDVQGITSYNHQQDCFTINVYIHIVRRSNGTGGLTTSEVDNSLLLLTNDFLLHQIHFIEQDRGFIDNDTYYNFSDIHFNSIVQEFNHTNAIDIIFLPSSISYGRASGIPGTALVLGGAFAETSVLSHEMGHCLGLYHTHSGRGCFDFVNCVEAIDGSNCNSCGDLVCDTPADPCLSGNVNSNCEYTGPDDFNPDVDNILSYAPPSCLDQLTIGQIERVYTMIENSILLQNTLWNGEGLLITGSDIVCSSGNTYSINDLPSGTSVAWISSSNISFPSGNTGSSVSAKAYSLISSGAGWIEATINSQGCGSITLPRKDVWVGKVLPLDIQVVDRYMGWPKSEFCSGQAAPVQAKHIGGQAYIDNWDWSVTAGYITYDDYNDDSKVTLRPISYSFNVMLKAHNECGWTDWINWRTSVVSCGGMYMSVAPNPANEYTELNFYDSNELSEYQKDSKATVSVPTNEKTKELGEYEIQIWHQQKGLVKQLKSTEKHLQIPTNNLAEGTYFLHVIVNGKVHKQQLKIQR
jgi:hypothetical protein